jgi:hypothetical protein
MEKDIRKEEREVDKPRKRHQKEGSRVLEKGMDQNE